MTFKEFCTKTGEVIKKAGHYCGVALGYCWTGIKSVISYILKNPKELFYLILIIILCLFLFRSCSEKSNLTKIYNDNIEALSDSIHTYKTKNGTLVCERDILIGEIDVLKVTNAELYDDLKELKATHAETVVKLEAVINNETHDTVYVLEEQTHLNITKSFDFSNEYRTLNGNIKLNNDTLSLAVDSDKVYVDFTVAVEDNNVKIKSDNPYIEYKDVYGITIPEYKDTWSLNVGPSLNIGYDPIHKTFSPTIGISVTFGYNICSFGKRIKR